MPQSIECQNEAKVSIEYLNILRAHASYIARAVQQLPLETACIELQRAVYEISHNSRKRLGENLQKFVALQGILEAELQLVSLYALARP